MKKSKIRELLSEKEKELAEWARSLGILRFGQVLEVRITVKQALPAASIVVLVPSRSHKDRLANRGLSHEPLSVEDWAKIEAVDWNPKHRKIIVGLRGANSVPMWASSLMSNDITTGINSRLKREGLAYRLTTPHLTRGGFPAMKIRFFKIEGRSWQGRRARK